MNMEITFTEYEIKTLLTAIDYFDILDTYEVPYEESEWTEDHKYIDEISGKLEDISYSLEDSETVVLSAEQISYLLSALYAYKSIVVNNVKTKKKSKFNQAEQFTIQSDINQLYDSLNANLSELDPDFSVFRYDVPTDASYV
ncbi:MAG: hypothetical protein IJC09_06265 [Clostridia bacterium]|nr:hypothetical protein [Clostridia bacterium]